MLLLHAVDPGIASAYSRQDVLLFHFILFSRSFGLPGPHKLLALIPLGDIINHDHTHPTVLLHESKEFVFFKTTEEVMAGSEVFSSYGKKDNARYLMYYGFVMENDPAMDMVEVLYDVPVTYREGDGDWEEGERGAAQGESRVVRSRYTYWLALQDTASSRERVLSTLRQLVHITQEGDLLRPVVLEGGTRSGTTDSRASDSARGGVTMGRQHEKKVLLALAKMCQLHLKT